MKRVENWVAAVRRGREPGESKKEGRRSRKERLRLLALCVPPTAP